MISKLNYYTIRVVAKQCSMLHCHYLASAAPVFALVMAMHALDKRLAPRSDANGMGIGCGLGLTGVGIVHHNFDPKVEYFEERMPNGHVVTNTSIVQRRGACSFGSLREKQSAHPMSNSFQIEALADFEWSLILECRVSPGDNDVTLMHDELMSMRLAGGRVEHCSVKRHETLDNALKHVGRGFWVTDATPRMTGDGSHALNPIERMLDLTRTSSWLILANLGFALLDSPTSGRDGVRHGGAHAFAESMIGLVKMESMAKFRSKDDKQALPSLWRYGWSGSQFIVTDSSAFVLQQEVTP